MRTGKMALILFLVICILSGCGSPTHTGNRSAMLTEDGAKEITIEVGMDNSELFKEAADKFEKDTGIRVNINEFTSFQKTCTELMAGKGADIYANLILDLQSDRTLFYDMADRVSEDSDFNNQTYNMGMINAEMTDGKLYVLPISYAMSTITSSIEVQGIKGSDHTNWEQFIELTKDIKRSGILLGIDDQWIFNDRFRARVSEFIDEENKTQRLNTNEMINLLKQCKEWGEQGLCIKSSQMQNQNWKDALFRFGAGSACDVVHLINIQGEPGTYIYNSPSDSKESGISTVMTDFVYINTASQYKSTAWKFIKFLLSEEMQSSPALGFMPVNRKAMDMVIDNQISDLLNNGINFDNASAKNEIATVLDKAVAEKVFFNSNYEDIVEQEAKPYFLDQITAEEAAKNMADKIELYLKEQG